jgi:DME family drug/metabolite transporter
MIAIVLAALLWGTTGTVASTVPPDVGPLAVGAATMCVGGLLLALTAPRLTRGVLNGGAASWRWLVPGALGVVVYPLAFYSSMSLAGVAVGNVVSLGTAPVFAALLERTLDSPARRRPLEARWVASAALAVVGVALLAATGQHPAGPEATAQVVGSADAATAATASGASAPLGIALGVLAGLAYATYTYTAGRLIAEGHPSRGAMSAQFGLGAVLLLPVLLATGAPLLGSGASVGAAAYLALGPMFVAYLLFGRGLRTVSSSRATTVTLLEPFVATLLAVLVVGERLGPPGWLGLALVLAGVVSVVLARPPRPSRPGAVAA